MVTVWLKGSTPHVEPGLRINSMKAQFVDQLAVHGEDEWIVVDLEDGRQLNLRVDQIIAFQAD
jgi:hypothetical protein